MALAVRRSILMKCFSAVCCPIVTVCVLNVPALAQHPAGRVAGAPMPVPASPVIHTPVYHAPTYQVPTYLVPTYQVRTRQNPIYRNPGYAPIYAPFNPVWSPARAGVFTVRPPFQLIRPIRPIFSFYFFPGLNGPFRGSNFCWWATCDQFWTSSLLYNFVPLNTWNPANFSPPIPPEAPMYVYGEQRPDNPQLFLKDGTIVYVTDYWVVDNQLHFTITDEDAMKPEEQVIPYDELDLQKSVDVNTKRGFRFMLRNEPFEQYVRDHPEGPPAALSPQNP